MICCVAIVGANNNPLFVRSIEEDDDLSFHYIVHISLDIIEEKGMIRSDRKVDSCVIVVKLSKDDMYLGFLGPVEDYRVYGYVTNTLVKIIVVVQDAPIKESEMRNLFTELHKLYVNAMSNPFAIIGERIKSEKFEKKVYNLVLQHNHMLEASR
ncbi:trafficking protein particle complex subunit 2 [Thraustotheca clavata]|uniref:Trafficking protein particle complex subunit 2-like protein n=1 Tax=Thraustotheca clavata TaxID=74557 RepID=A0A1V9Y706_9STRA|nr:trafficking protein particle complex subunit 2 [Thraustotheca clavata]